MPKITIVLNMTQNTALTEICIPIHCPMLCTAANKWRKTLPLMNFLWNKVWRISHGRRISELKRAIQSNPLIQQGENWRPERAEIVPPHCKYPTSSPKGQSSLKYLLSFSVFIDFPFKNSLIMYKLSQLTIERKF